MQLIPGTASRFKVRNAFDPTENVHGGLAYLRWLLAYYRGQVTLVAAAYNAGENAVDRHRGVPPYAETREYVRRIQRYFRAKSIRMTRASSSLHRSSPAPGRRGCSAAAAGLALAVAARGRAACERAGFRDDRA